MSHSSGQLSLLVKMPSSISTLVDTARCAPTKSVPATGKVYPRASYKTAHFPEYGLIVVLVSPGFVKLRASEQPKFVGKLQEAAKTMGFVGTVVPVWRSGDSFDFLCASVFEPHVKALRWIEILERVDGGITC